MFALRGKHHGWIVTRVQVAMIKDCLRISEDEIHMAFDVAVAEVLARSLARGSVSCRRTSISRQILMTRPAIRIQGVLCSEPAGSRWTPLDNGGPMAAAGDLLDWVGENIFADDISEAEARNLFPAAFCH